MGTNRGTAGRAGLITQGFAGIPEFVVIALTPKLQQLDRRRLVGGSRPKPQIDFVIAWVKLISVNDEQIAANISGTIKVPISQKLTRVFSEHILSRTKSAIEYMRVKITRIR